MTTRNPRAIRIASLLALLAASAHSSAQSPVPAPQATPSAPAKALPTVDEVFAHSVRAVGGADLIAQQSSRTQHGAIEMPAQGLKGQIVTKSCSPDFLLVETTIPGFGKISQGMNKSVGWTIDPMRGPSLMTAEELAQVKREASSESEINPGKGYDAVEVVAEVAFKGTTCYKVKFTKGKIDSFKYYAVDTGLLTGSEDTVESSLGTMQVISIYKDYGDFSGRKVAKVQEATTMGQMQRVTVDSIDFSPVDPAVFALPAEIQALVTTQAVPPPPVKPATK